MADLIEVQVSVIDTTSSWREISTLFEKELMDWVVGDAFITSLGPNVKTISISTQFAVDEQRVFERKCEEKTPWFSPANDYITNLSILYPGTFFTYTYQRFLGGREATEQVIQEEKQKYLDRILTKDPRRAKGACHCVEIMPDGRVAADGDNRWGNCDVFDWNIYGEFRLSL